VTSALVKPILDETVLPVLPMLAPSMVKTIRPALRGFVKEIFLTEIDAESIVKASVDVDTTVAILTARL
jgi:hypothetical protein